jgi:predicted nucleic acid-binding protein
MIIISDTTPIITLLKINQLDLLQKLFQEIYIPESVYDELTQNLKYISESEIIKNSIFIKKESINDHQAVSLLK